jgi:hypothetical protein
VGETPVALWEGEMSAPWWEGEGGGAPPWLEGDVPWREPVSERERERERGALGAAENE